jgi:hypothetical protein
MNQHLIRLEEALHDM